MTQPATERAQSPAPIEVPLGPSAIVETLDEAARRGKLAGFRRGEGGPLFVTEAWGTPFEGELLVDAAGAGELRTRLSFRTRMVPRFPAIFGVVLVLSVWPGVVLTKSLLGAMMPGWGWLWQTTWYWYLPLSIIGGVWAWVVAMKRSRASIATSAREMTAKVGALLGVKGSEASG